MTTVGGTALLPADGVDLVYPGTVGAIEGRLHTEPDAKGLVVIAYPTAFSRFGRNDELLCSIAHDAGYSTLSVDLLTPEEMTIRTDELPGHVVRRLASVLEDSRRRGHCAVVLFAIGEAAPAALPAAGGHPIEAIVTCALPGVVDANETDVARASSGVLECTPTQDAPLTWDEIDQAMRRAVVWFDAALAQPEPEPEPATA